MALRCPSSFFSLPYQTRNSSSPSHPSFSDFRSLSFSTNTRSNYFSKGYLSMSIVHRPINHSVVCMARRYAPNTNLRKKKARKRGGDSKKKQKRRRKGKSKKKDSSKTIRLVSDAGTGFVYITKKGRETKEKLKIRKYDPELKRHVLFQESK